MKADYSDPAAGLKPVGSVVEQGFQHPQLIVHGNPQGLEAAGGGMDAPMALFGRIAAGNGIGQSCGAPLAVIPGAFGLEPACNPPGKPFLAVVEEQIGQGVFLQAVDQRCGGFSAAFGVHAHVQRSVGAEAEAALGHIELMAADAQISQHRQYRFGWGVGREVAGHQLHALTKTLQLLAGCCAGSGVLIQPNQLPARVGIEQQAAMASTAHGGIEQHPFFGQFGQGFQHLLRQHRLVMKGTAQVRKGMAQGPS